MKHHEATSIDVKSHMAADRRHLCSLRHIAAGRHVEEEDSMKE